MNPAHLLLLALLGGGWTSKAPLPFPVFTENTPVAVNGRIYLVDSHGVVEYDPATDRWTGKGAPMPTFRHDFETVALDGKVYAIGGCGGGDQHIQTGATEVYDPATNAWRKLAPMPTARMALALAAVGGKIYAIGGLHKDNRVSAVEVYDPATDQWTRKRDWSRVDTNVSAAQGPNGKILVFGAYEGNGVLDEYDPAADAFRPLRAPAFRSCAATALMNGRLLAIGGHFGDDTPALATIESYDPATNAWTALPALPEPRSCPGAVALDGRLFVIGGSAPRPWRDAQKTVVALDQSQ